MKRNVYDRTRATRLVPILRSIMTEILQRTSEAETLEARIESLSTPQRRVTEARELQSARAALAVHRRELRRANEELAHIGCALDGDHPQRILIPGESGGLRDGFAWNAADESLNPMSAEAAS